MEDAKPKPRSLAEFGDLESASLAQRSALLEAIDNGVIDATEQEMKELGQLRKDKVDSYHHTILEKEAAINALKQTRKMYDDEISILENELKRIKRLLNYNSDLNNNEPIPGNEFVIVAKDSVTTKFRVDADAGMALRFPGFVKATYSWKAAEAKKHLKDKNHAIHQVAFEDVRPQAKMELKETWLRKEKAKQRKIEREKKKAALEQQS